MGIERDMQAQDDLALAERAAAWIAALEQGDTDTDAAFAAWLKESPRHVEEALFAATVSEELRKFDPARRIDVKALLAQHAPNVVPLPPAIPTRAAASSPARFWPWAAGIAVLILGAGVAAWWHGLGPGSWQSYATDFGEQRTVELRDGSLVHLNTQSHMRSPFPSCRAHGREGAEKIFLYRVHR